MPHVRDVARGLAIALLCGNWIREEMAERLRSVLGKRGKWKEVDSLVEQVLEQFGSKPPSPTLQQLCSWLLKNRIFSQKLSRNSCGVPRQFDLSKLPPPVMRSELFSGQNFPAIVTPEELAEWLQLSPTELEWLADCHGEERNRSHEKLRHYRYRWVCKSNGGSRLIENPKTRLKEIQRLILREILSQVPAHPAAHAFCSKRSISTFAAPHRGQRVVLRIDLRNFFPSVKKGRILGLFRTIGYPEAVARLFSGLCTNSVPLSLFENQELSSASHPEMKSLYGDPHLPQGAPTSPALANLAAWKLDCRLKGLSDKFDAVYTRYADDLVFSGGRSFERRLSDFRVWVLAIVLDEGFMIHHRKTHVMPSGGRQQVAGVLINEHPNISRSEYDRMKAILFNCKRHGPLSQLGRYSAQKDSGVETISQLRHHLMGKISFVKMLNPVKGERLRKSFEEIEWEV